MTAPTIEPETRPAEPDTGDDDPDHAYCSHANRTWCGLDSSGMVLMPMPAIERICRVCLLAAEMYRNGDPCPVCGCRECLE